MRVEFRRTGESEEWVSARIEKRATTCARESCRFARSWMPNQLCSM